MRHRSSVILLSVLVLGPAAALRAAAPPILLADINRLPVESSAFPRAFNEVTPQMQPAELGGILYFAASDPAHGRELWRSDGTAAGTWRVSDINPGPGDSNPQNFFAHGGRVWFSADDGVRGIEIWSTDGTAKGTLLLGDLCPGPCSSPRFGYTTLASAGGRLFFTASSTGGNPRLWSTDGTRDGTAEVGSPEWVFLHAPLPQGRVLFDALETGGEVLWTSDGTPGGTSRLLANDGSSFHNAYGFIRLGDAVLFWMGSSLWRTDGTPQGTQLLREGIPGPSAPALAANGIAWFANERGDLWATDGTALGTVGVGSGFSRDYGYTPSPLTASSCGPVFAAGTQGASQLRVWRIPTSGPVEAVSPALPYVVGPWSAGDRVFFAAANYPAQTSDLWTLDPDSCQAERVTSLCGDGRSCASGVLPFLPANAGRTAVFVLNTATEGAELWRSDGTEAGTFRVRDIGFDPGSGTGEPALLGGKALFAARPGAGPAGLWHTDGTAAGTRAVKFVPSPQRFFSTGNALYFTAGTPGDCEDARKPCQGLWRTDGTRTGTRQLAAGAFYVKGLAAGGGRLLLSAADDPNYWLGTGREPWVSDGTAAGTRRVTDINQQIYPFPFGGFPGVGSSTPGPAVWTGSRFLFAADDGIHGRELWSTDGTAAGTALLADLDRISVGGRPSDSNPGSFAPLGSSFLFAADDGVEGRELWATDGTAPGTRPVRDLLPGPLGSSPHDLVAFGGKVWFLASNTGSADGGEAIWTSDGTADGTLRVADLGARGRSLTAVGSRLFFVVDDEALGTELWTSDGTTAGTRLVRDIRPGAGGSYPRSLTAVDGLLVFAADDGASGLEPWVSDGTAAGTRRLGDLAPGADASSPGPFVVAGAYVVFPAWDPVHSRELWAVLRAGLR
jgi:ELWxxDGT repeat protein